ncbi:MAG: FtsX-like permease family protein [Epulopiscium sp.]|jgi:putative ABC transport system permease protein|nr:FtsX-like permease family protein [Candidatus Epulonipiscium sp.]
MNFLESLKSALRNLTSNKMRSFLTMLGIIIGIGSVIMITSIGAGSQAAITSEFDKLGVGLLQIRMKSWDNVKTRDLLTLDDVELIKKHPEVKNATPYIEAWGISIKLKNPKEEKSGYIIGANEEYRFITSPDMLYGRFIIESDCKAKSKVAVIDEVLAEKVFGRKDVIGESITVNIWRGNFKFTVIGVTKNANAALESMMGDQMPSSIIVPIQTVNDMFFIDYLDYIFVTVKNSDTMQQTAIELNKMLEIKHRNEDVYYISSFAEELEMVNQVLGIITAFISFVAGISLFVGGIGVMNIMLVTVTERTREIGIRKSLGARNKDIKKQFLIEAVILTVIGGIMGIIFGFLGGMAVGSMMKITPRVSFFSILVTVGVSSIVGIIAGVYPANKAAKLDPIEALRYE